MGVDDSPLPPMALITAGLLITFGGKFTRLTFAVDPEGVSETELTGVFAGVGVTFAGEVFGVVVPFSGGLVDPPKGAVNPYLDRGSNLDSFDPFGLPVSPGVVEVSQCK